MNAAQGIVDQIRMFRRIESYALSIRQALGGKLNVFKMEFIRIPETHSYHPDGSSSDIWQMDGTRKRYRITITPIEETHR